MSGYDLNFHFMLRFITLIIACGLSSTLCQAHGSKHLNERALKFTNSKLGEHGRTLILTIPDLAPPRGLELQCTLKAPDGKDFTRSIHATIHRLN